VHLYSVALFTLNSEMILLTVSIVACLFAQTIGVIQYRKNLPDNELDFDEHCVFLFLSEY
jgi:hypothetical protein